MAPSAIDNGATAPAAAIAANQQELPPRHTYPVSEMRFEKYIEPQPEGYAQASTRDASTTAIVIDNGE